MAATIIATKNVSLDISPGAANPVVHCSQYDSGYQLTFTLYNGSSLFEIPNDCSVRIDEVKVDKTAYHGDLTISPTNKSKCYIWMATQMSIVPGDQICELVITNTATRRIGSANFILRVEPAPEADTSTYSVTQLAIGTDMQNKYPNLASFETALNAKAPLSATMGYEVQRQIQRGGSFRTNESDAYSGGAILIWHNGPVVHVTFTVTAQRLNIPAATERVVFKGLPAAAHRVYLTPTMVEFTAQSSTDSNGQTVTTQVPTSIGGNCVCTIRLASESRPVWDSTRGLYVSTAFDPTVLQIDGALNPTLIKKGWTIYGSFSYLTTESL